jgi:hypothetical protein
VKIVWNYIFIFTGLALLLQICGIQIAGLAQIFSLLGIIPSTAGVSFSTYPPFMVGVLAILAAASVTGIIIGIFTRASPENYVIVPAVGTSLYLYVSMIYSIITYSSMFSWVGIVIGMILFPFAISLIFSFIDWFRGGDF